MFYVLSCFFLRDARKNYFFMGGLLDRMVSWMRYGLLFNPSIITEVKHRFTSLIKKGVPKLAVLTHPSNYLTCLVGLKCE